MFLLSLLLATAEGNEDQALSRRNRMRALFNKRRISEEGKLGKKDLSPRTIRLRKLKPKKTDPEDGEIISVSVSSSESVSTSRIRPKKLKSDENRSENEIIKDEMPLKILTKTPAFTKRLIFRKNKLKNNQRDIFNKLLSRINVQNR